MVVVYFMSDVNVHCYHANYYWSVSLERDILSQESVEAIKNVVNEWARTYKKKGADSVERNCCRSK